MLPKISIDKTENITEARCNKTLRIDFDKKCLGEVIDGVDALKQAIHMSLITKRYKYPIFSHFYGTDYEDVSDAGYLTTVGKLKNAIEDSLLFDDRILEVSDFEFGRNGKAITVQFKVTSIYGQLDYKTEVK